MSTGYACPVCDDPQADVGHLANHLAFTAMLREDEHGDWLDEHVPGWQEYDEAGLSAALEEHTDLLEEREYPQVFEDTTGDSGEASGRDAAAERSGALFDDEGASGHQHAHAHDHQHSHGDDHQHSHDPGRTQGRQSAGLPGDVDTAAMPGEVPEEEREAIMAEAREMTRKLREGSRDEPAEGASGEEMTDDGAVDGGGDEAEIGDEAEDETEEPTRGDAPGDE